MTDGAPPSGPSNPAPAAERLEAPARNAERLGIVSFTNVAPLHWQLAPWGEGEGRVRFVRGVPTELNRALLDGEIDLTLISSVEFLRHRERLRALPDFSIATLGPVRSVTLFHWRPWEELDGARIRVSSESATSVRLLEVLLEQDGLRAELEPSPPRLEAMLDDADAALLIGDAALREGVARRELAGGRPRLTDLGAAWYQRTRLPFTFAVWASRDDRPPSELLVAKLRAAREHGLGHLADVAADAARPLGLSPSTMLHYLGNFRYYLQPPDRDGLLAFGRRALPGLRDEEVRFWDA